ncbi:hypothetical protein Tco_1258094, partial [Tanacetum coccineum]
KAQRIKPTLYDGSVISSQHVACPVIDDEETLILEDLQTSHPNTDQSTSSPVQIEAPKELPKVSMVNRSRKKLKYHLEQFDAVVKKQITPDAITEWEWGSESCVKCLNLDAEFLNKQNAYNGLLKSYSQLEKHCISLELTMQLNQEIFQKDSLSNNQNALEILKYFENNDLKAQLQAKDTTICKLKEHIKYLRENDKEEKVKQDVGEIETINIEVEHSVAKLLSENKRLHKEIEHLKKIYKDQFDSIKKTRALSKEHSDSLIAQLNSKSMENADLKRKEIVENVVQIPIATTIAPVEQAKATHPLDIALDFACKVFTEVGHKWKPTGRFFTIVGNSCPLTRITPTKVVHLKETTSNSGETPKPEIKVYSRRPKQIKSVGSSKKTKIVESKIANNSEPNHLWGSNATDVPSSSSLFNDSKILGTVRFGNNQIAKIMGYGDYQLGNIINSRVYYVEGLGHNLFSVGQFCNADLEVAF